ncbi:MAG TPA: AbrB/MazE/SpoVT family DNA-binding domain-containing protein [Acidobacteriota bacterium]|jgi:AbrB family looped-hinge helix DNA binding protein
MAKLEKGGRIVIPAEYRKALGLESEDEVTLIMEEDGLRLLSADQAVRRAQSLVRRYVPKGRKLSSELIQQRRKEAKRE